MSHNEWFTGIEDTNGINGRIKAIEQEISLLQQPQPQDNNINEKVHDLSSTLQLAILNDDLETIDALIISYGDLPNLVDAKQLIQEKRDLILLQSQELSYQDIMAQISQTESHDLSTLKIIKEKIISQGSEELKRQLIENFDAKVISFREDSMSLFQASLKAKSWINSPVLDVSTEYYFKDLINLQALLFKKQTTIWAFDIIAENFKISFDYHFNGDKDTNRIDKPELFFTYHLNYLENHLSKLNRLFDLSKTELPSSFAYNEFIKSSIVSIKYKLLSFVNNLRYNLDLDPENEQDVNLLTHLIFETIKYDTVLISQYFYDPEYDGEWAGLIGYFDYDDLDHVLNSEIRHNLKLFNQILNSTECFQIDYTSALVNELKPTVSALKLKFLFEKLNKSFTRFFHTNYLHNKSLQKFKLKLFSKVYLNILQLYYTRLNEGLTAFSELFKKSKNFIKSSSSVDEIDISGVKGLERLFRIYNSLKYISNSLNYWNQEFIFIELNELFNQLSSSKSVSLFDTILLDYNALINKTIKLIVDFHSKLIKTHLQRYDSKSWFLTPSETINTSIELSPLLEILEDTNEFQAKVLSNYEMIQFQNRQSLNVIQQFHQSVIKSNQFNTAGLDQLFHDFNTVMSYFPLSKGSKAYRHISEIFLIFNEFQDVDMGGLEVNQYAKLGDYRELRDCLKLKMVSNNDILDTLLRIRD